jgi:hypothetical protein
MALVVDILLVVTEVLYAIPTELITELTLGSVVFGVPPFPNCVEHDLMALSSPAVPSSTMSLLCHSNSRMVKYALDDAVNSFLGVGLTIPALNDLRNSPTQHGRRYSACRFVEHIGEVILGKHAVGWIG